MFKEYIQYATTNCRLPLKLRTDKIFAREFLNYLKTNNIEIMNKDLYVLTNWLSDGNTEEYVKIKSIKYLDERELVADFTVPETHSYIANGIVVHNCNLPETATKQLVSDVYMKAWESKCKGFTIYRDKCRTGVLISESESKANQSGRPGDIVNLMAPKRPTDLNCDIKKAKVNGEAWTIFVGLMNGKPYEVFGGLSKFVDIPNKNKVGKIVKNGKSPEGLTTYNLEIGDSDDKMIVKDIANIFENKNNEAFTRMISLNLRHGTPIQFVVEQLTKDKFAEMTSFSKVIARVLKSYIKDGLKSSVKCEDCKAENTIIYQEGCMTCTSCKWSKCN